MTKLTKIFDPNQPRDPLGRWETLVGNPPPSRYPTPPVKQYVGAGKPGRYAIGGRSVAAPISSSTWGAISNELRRTGKVVQAEEFRRVAGATKILEDKPGTWKPEAVAEARRIVGEFNRTIQPGGKYFHINPAFAEANTEVRAGTNLIEWMKAYRTGIGQNMTQDQAAAYANNRLGVTKFDPDQPRDDHGRWSELGAKVRRGLKTGAKVALALAPGAAIIGLHELGRAGRRRKEAESARRVQALDEAEERWRNEYVSGRMGRRPTGPLVPTTSKPPTLTYSGTKFPRDILAVLGERASPGGRKVSPDQPRLSDEIRPAVRSLRGVGDRQLPVDLAMKPRSPYVKPRGYRKSASNIEGNLHIDTYLAGSKSRKKKIKRKVYKVWSDEARQAAEVVRRRKHITPAEAARLQERKFSARGPEYSRYRAAVMDVSAADVGHMSPEIARRYGREASAKVRRLRRLAARAELGKFDPDQPRDDQGQWTDTGGGGGGASIGGRQLKANLIVRERSTGKLYEIDSDTGEAFELGGGDYAPTGGSAKQLLRSAAGQFASSVAQSAAIGGVLGGVGSYMAGAPVAAGVKAGLASGAVTGAAFGSIMVATTLVAAIGAAAANRKIRQALAESAMAKADSSLMKEVAALKGERQRRFVEKLIDSLSEEEARKVLGKMPFEVVKPTSVKKNGYERLLDGMDAAEQTLAAARQVLKYDPNQPRDEEGKWTDTGASSGLRVNRWGQPQPTGKERLLGAITTAGLTALGAPIVAPLSVPIAVAANLYATRGAKYRPEEEWTEEAKRADKWKTWRNNLIATATTVAGATGAYVANFYNATRQVAGLGVKYGVDPSKVTVRHGIKIMAAGGTAGPVAGVYNSATHEIDIYPLGTLLAGSAKSTIAHEMTHAKSFPAFEKSKAIKGFLKSNAKGLQAEGGVTPYSNLYWKDYNQSSGILGPNQRKFELAIHETLAEMSSVKERTGVLPGGPLHKQLYNTILPPPSRPLGPTGPRMIQPLGKKEKPRPFAVAKYDPDQPRDEEGKWTDTGAGGGKSKLAITGAAAGTAAVGVGGAYAANFYHAARLAPKMAAKYGVDPKTVNVRHGVRSFKKWRTMGNYWTGTKEINIYPLSTRLLSTEGIKSVMAHELTHARAFHAFDHDSKVRGFALANLDNLQREGGVTPYSKMYWRRVDRIAPVPKKPFTSPASIALRNTVQRYHQDAYQLAIHETLAEMSLIKEHTGKLPGGPYHKQLYEQVFAPAVRGPKGPGQFVMKREVQPC